MPKPEYSMSLKEVIKMAGGVFRINKRTFQWYVTNGLLPMAKKDGRDGYYDPYEKDSILDYLSAVDLLLCDRASISEIKRVIKEYKEERAKGKDVQCGLTAYALYHVKVRHSIGIDGMRLIDKLRKIDKEIIDNAKD